MNSFGHRFRFTTFGESHGKALGCIVDGVPAGIKIDEEFIQAEMNRRKPGQNEFATKRNEGDIVEILTSKNAHPSSKWLEHAKTGFARRKINSYIEEQGGLAGKFSVKEN